MAMRLFRVACTIAVLAAGACAGALAARAAPPPPRQPPALALPPGIIIDPTHPALHLMKQHGGIEALDPVSGHPLWTSTAASKPLLQCRDVLVAQAEATAKANVLRIVLLDHQTGGVRATADIELPDV